MITLDANFETRKVDAKRRIVIPLKNSKEVFMVNRGSFILISPSKRSLENLLNKIDQTDRIEQLQALKEWFELVDDSGLNKLAAADIHQRIGDVLHEKTRSSLERRDKNERE